MGARATVASAQNSVETVEPFLAFFLRDGQVLAPRAFANVVGIACPHPLSPQTQGHAIRRDGQSTMDKQTSTRTVAKRSQAFGGFQAAPVDFRGILHRQDQGHLVEAMVGGFDMTLHDVVGRDVVIFGYPRKAGQFVT
jgi:hypothetical protein